MGLNQEGAADGFIHIHAVSSETARAGGPTPHTGILTRTSGTDWSLSLSTWHFIFQAARTRGCGFALCGGLKVTVSFCDSWLLRGVGCGKCQLRVLPYCNAVKASPDSEGKEMDSTS